MPHPVSPFRDEARDVATGHPIAILPGIWEIRESLAPAFDTPETWVSLFLLTDPTGHASPVMIDTGVPRSTHTVILPHATAYNRDAAPDAMRRIAAALGAKDAAEGIYDLIGKIGAPRALKDIGMPADGLDKAADLALTNRYWNPRELERPGIRALLQNAYDGARPSPGR